MKCDIFHTSVKGQKWVILIGLYKGFPYEVIGGEAELIEILLNDPDPRERELADGALQERANEQR